MKKKFLVLFATITMLLLFGAANASAGVILSGECGDNLKWEIDDTSTVTISGTGDMYDGHFSHQYYELYDEVKAVVIGQGVTSISNKAFDYCRNLTSVTIASSATMPSSVTSIGEKAFFDCIGLTSITIPDSVTSIGDDAFYNCRSLTNITIGNNVTSIGGGAFYRCTGLTSITIPDGVTSIGDGAFSDCAGLTSITIPDSVTSIGDGAFSDCAGLTNVTIGSGITSIGNNAFYNCSNLTSVNIPNSVTSIGEYAFYNCSGLTNVTIGNGVTSIGDRAFYDCTGLTSIKIPDSVTSIGDYAFLGCEELTSVTIGSGVSSIGKKVLEGCNSIKTVNYNAESLPDIFSSTSSIETVILGNNVKNIDHGAFSGCRGLTSLTIPDSVTSIGDYAFHYCEGLTGITIPNSVTSIGNGAFYNCTGLTSITIPDSVTSIGDNAFSDCKGLTGITIGSGVTSIGGQVFSYCDNLENVYIKDLEKWCGITFGSENANPMCYADNLYLNGELLTQLVIPNSITSIGDYAFDGCGKISSVTIPDNVTSIGDDAFRGCGELTSVTIGSGVTSIDYYAFEGCDNIKTVSYNAENLPSVFHEKRLIETFILGNNVKNIEGGAFSGCAGLTSITIPDSVTSIDTSNLFSECTGLISVTLPNSVTSIGDSTFSGCESLTSIEIPDGVTSIGENAFYGCKGLTSITIPDGVTSISDSTFSGCESLTSIEIPDGVTSIGEYAFYGCKGLTSITIPDGVTSIGENAFYGCNGLTSITIPDGVTSIGDYAFWGCESLTSIEIPGGVTSIDNNAFYGCGSLENLYIKDLEKWCGITFESKYANPAAYADNLYVNDELITQLVIPDNVTSIGNYAFFQCRGLTGVTIPDSVTAIGAEAFSGCYRLADLTIPDSVTSIGEHAFYNIGITSITIPDNVKDLAYGAFDGCRGLTSAVLGSGITEIERVTFRNCPLKKIYIPKSVTEIADEAFNTRIALTTVEYEGSEEEWNAITIAEYGNDYLKNANILYNVAEPSGYVPDDDPSDDPSPKPSGDPSPKPSDDPSPKPSDDPKPEETPNPEAHQVDITRVIKTDTAIVLDAALDTAIDNTSIYAAVYDENGCLIKVKKVTPSETGKTRVEIERSASEDTVKVMAWTDGLIPVAKTDEVNLSDYDEVYYSQDYEADGATVDWTTSLAERYTPQIMTASDGNKYLGVNQAERYNNGTTLTSKDISYSGKTYAFEFDAKLMSSDDQTETELTINSPAGVLLKLNEADNRTTSWILNDDINIDLPETASVRPEDEENIDDSIIDAIPWYHFKLLSDMGAVYVSVSDEDGDEILALTPLDSAAKTLKGLKNMTFKTSRYYSNFGIDNVIIRPLTAEELELAPPPEEPVDEPIVKNSFDAATGAIIYLNNVDTDPYTDVEGLTLYIGTRKGGAESSVNFAYATGGRTGNALVLNSGKFVSDNRGPRFKINTPDMTDVSELVAELYVKPVDGSDGEAALYYNDSNTAQATTKLALTTDEWNKLTIRLKKAGGQVTRTIYVNDAEKASDKVSTFPVFWGTAVDKTNSKLYFDDLTVRAVE